MFAKLVGSNKGSYDKVISIMTELGLNKIGRTKIISAFNGTTISASQIMGEGIFIYQISKSLLESELKHNDDYLLMAVDDIMKPNFADSFIMSKNMPKDENNQLYIFSIFWILNKVKDDMLISGFANDILSFHASHKMKTTIPVIDIVTKIRKDYKSKFVLEVSANHYSVLLELCKRMSFTTNMTSEVSQHGTICKMKVWINGFEIATECEARTKTEAIDNCARDMLQLINNYCDNLTITVSTEYNGLRNSVKILSMSSTLDKDTINKIWNSEITTSGKGQVVLSEHVSDEMIKGVLKVTSDGVSVPLTSAKLTLYIGGEACGVTIKPTKVPFETIDEGVIYVKNEILSNIQW